jgi:hypothetical protein
MNTSKERQRSVLVTVLVAGIITSMGVTIAVLSSRSKDKGALENVRDTNHKLRSQIEDRDRTISDLKSSVQELQAALQRRAESKPRPILSSDPELARRLIELISTQTQTLALVEKVAAKTGASDSPERTGRNRQAGITVLEESQAEQEQKVLVAKKKTAELLETLKIPDDVFALQPERVLGMPSLRTYWPFFEARGDQEMQQMILDRIRLRLFQEKLDARVHEKSNSQ